jgi:hypothetical protein
MNLADLAPRMRELRARQDAVRAEFEAAQYEEAPGVTLDDYDIAEAADLFRSIVQDCEHRSCPQRGQVSPSVSFLVSRSLRFMPASIRRRCELVR